MGDIESAPFVESMRQFQFRAGPTNFALIHVSLVPVVGGEQKTKPTQATIRDLRGLGLMPDLVSTPPCLSLSTELTTHPCSTLQIACRCLKKLEPSTTNKISMFCHVPPSQVFAVHDVSSVYHVPLLLKSQGIVGFLEKKLELHDIKRTSVRTEGGLRLLTRWQNMTVG